MVFLPTTSFSSYKACSYSEYASFLAHLQQCSFLNFNDKDMEHNEYATEFAYLCYICQTPLTFQMMIIQHTNLYSSEFTKGMGVDPSPVIDITTQMLLLMLLQSSYNDKD